MDGSRTNHAEVRPTDAEVDENGMTRADRLDNELTRQAERYGKEVARLRSVLHQAQIAHDEWGATGNHHEAFKALRYILSLPIEGAS